MKVWPRVKLGIIPLIILGIPVWLMWELGSVINSLGFHFFKSSLLNVPLNVAVILTVSFLLGYLLDRSQFQNFIKRNYVNVPFPFSLIWMLFLSRGEVKLIQIQTYDGNWEYALETMESWEEGGKLWHRVHTLGWTGKLFSQVRDDNVKEVDRPERAVWMSVFSLGLFNPPK